MAWTRRIILLLCLSLAPALSQAACADLTYRQFDFWLGDWEVSDAAGKVVGHNRVEKIYGGCVLQEHWSSAQGGSGSSFNTYDGTRKVWHQTWVDSMGTLLVIEGGLKDGSMVMSGATRQADGKPLLNRITWTPKDGTVRQLWETSADGGRTWTTAFDGLYRRVR